MAMIVEQGKDHIARRSTTNFAFARLENEGF